MTISTILAYLSIHQASNSIAMGMVYKPLPSLPYNTTSEKDHLHACYILGPNYMIMFHQLHNDLRTVLVWCSCAIATSTPTKKKKKLKRQQY